MLFQLSDTEVLINPVVINQVQPRECLWNPRNVHYNNETEKYKAWEEVCVAILPKYTTSSEDDKKRIVKAVQSRWKTAHDAYMKCRLSELKKPTSKARQHSYIYQKLRFLEQVKDTDESVNNSVGDDEVGSISFVSDNSANQSNTTFYDYDVDEVSGEVVGFVMDVHDDFKEKTKDFDTALDVVEVRYDNNEQECLPGTSTPNNHQKHPLATADVTKPPKKRPRNADVIKPPKKRPRNADVTKPPRKSPRNADVTKPPRKSPRNADVTKPPRKRPGNADVTKPPRKKPRNARAIKLKRKKTAFEIKLIKRIMRLKKSANNSALQTDDQLFFNSLAPSIGNLDIHQKLKFRSKIMETLKEVSV